ncbi:hypothetical protein EVAR_27764_1 [Eumeta japonica]|uniref:Uncharacterized protein n=1 Tax=Eumeta variegata TaxID=151549 RepID=A0A4C1VB21_EUMVA|nr:hypothetical protein EVAR_27764_1 [Eumeta japonica]
MRNREKGPPARVLMGSARALARCAPPILFLRSANLSTIAAEASPLNMIYDATNTTGSADGPPATRARGGRGARGASPLAQIRCKEQNSGVAASRSGVSRRVTLFITGENGAAADGGGNAATMARAAALSRRNVGRAPPFTAGARR